MFTSRRSRFVLLTVAAAATAASAAPNAFAIDQRWASPTGYGQVCSGGTPCQIEDAVKNAAPGDEIVLYPGEYLVGETLKIPAQATIYGPADNPRPVVKFVGPSQWGLSLTNSTARHIEVDQEDPGVGATYTDGATLDQVVVRGGTAAVCAADVLNTEVRGSLVVARSGGTAVCADADHLTNITSLRNVTAVAGSGVAISADAKDSTATASVNVVNTIARSAQNGLGLYVHTGSPGAHATLTATHTNYAKFLTSGADAVFADGGGNQGAPPTFVDLTDYRQAPVSVTINAGLYNPLNGGFDVDGDARNIGQPDIGADEAVITPVVATGPTTAVTGTTATLTGSVDPKGSVTHYGFEYGTTTAYGTTSTMGHAGSGMGAVAVTATLSGLSPNTTYHYRLDAANGGGIDTGSDHTFTTAPAGTSSGGTGGAGGSGPTGGTGTSAQDFAGVALVSGRLALRGRFIVVKLTCPANTAGSCTGRTKLTARHRRLGRASFSIAAGKQGSVRVRVSRAGRRLFAHTRRLAGRASNAAHSATGEWRTNAAKVTIRKRSR